MGFQHSLEQTRGMRSALNPKLRQQRRPLAPLLNYLLDVLQLPSSTP